MGRDTGAVRLAWGDNAVMPDFSRLNILFVLANVVLGGIVGALSSLSPSFAALPIPIFGWLVLGVLLADLGFGALAGAHPSAVVTMPVRIVALVASYAASLVATSAFMPPV